MKCPKCGDEMIRAIKDTALEADHLIWVCETCGHEEEVFDGGC